MNPEELEREIDVALRRLPDPVAPESLVVSVMRQTRASSAERHGWLQPWFAWDARVQVVVALVAVVGAGALVASRALICAALQPLMGTEPFSVAQLLWHLARPVIAGGSVYVLVMGLMVTCVGAALMHVMSEGTSNS